MYFLNPKRTGRKNMFWAEMGRNLKVKFLKSAIFHVSLPFIIDFGPSYIVLKHILEVKNRFSSSFQMFKPLQTLWFEQFIGPKSTFEVKSLLKTNKKASKCTKTFFLTVRNSHNEPDDFGPMYRAEMSIHGGSRILFGPFYNPVYLLSANFSAQDAGAEM